MTAESQTHYLVQRYLLMTIDPLHIGAGGYRLGRVDLSIVREPGTRLPKIPGTSLHGAARQYADMQARLNGKQAICAGLESCGKSDCPICYTFGYINGKNSDGSEQKAYSGVVNVCDAHILLFPVHSIVGPIWVSTRERLEEAGFEATKAPEKDEEICLTWNHTGRLNLGWLMLDVAEQISVTPPQKSNWANEKEWKAISGRIVLVSENLFSHIVNSNLEVRTSVSIDPRTGAAADKALFTYESLPRATFLTAEVVLDEYEAENRPRPFPVEKINTGKPLLKGIWQGPLDVVKTGLKMMEFLGVGGMGTRGFGRIRVVGVLVEKDPLMDEIQEAVQ
jgi:CRISPR-associated protein Cmr4